MQDTVLSLFSQFHRLDGQMLQRVNNYRQQIALLTPGDSDKVGDQWGAAVLHSRFNLTSFVSAYLERYSLTIQSLASVSSNIIARREHSRFIHLLQAQGQSLPGTEQLTALAPLPDCLEVPRFASTLLILPDVPDLDVGQLLEMLLPFEPADDIDLIRSVKALPTEAPNFQEALRALHHMLNSIGNLYQEIQALKLTEKELEPMKGLLLGATMRERRALLRVFIDLYKEQ